MLNALSQIASKFRTRVGESLATVEKHNTPLAEATTPSLEALKAYSTGLRRFPSRRRCYRALPHFKRAVEIDPQFAMAYASMGLMYSDLGESVLSMESTSKAYQLRDRASDRERFFITALYDRQVTGNLEKAQQTLQSWAQTYPRDRDAHGLLSGFASQGSGQYEKSIEEAKKALGIDPDFAPGVCQCCLRLFLPGPLGGSREQPSSEPPSAKTESPELLLLRYYLAFFKGDTAGMERVAALARGKPGAEDWMLHCGGSGRGSFRPVASGQEDVTPRSWTWLSKQARGKERLPIKPQQRCGKRFSGTRPAARRSAMAALELSNGRDVEYGAAFALALAGRFVPGANARGRSGKALPGRYFSPIQLPASASRTLRTEPWRACKGDRPAASRRSL